MATTDLASSSSSTVSKADLELIKQTIAAGATDEELKLFLFDCRRRGTHPLDRQIHFARIGGRYQAIVGIDYLRSRAAMTGEYAGSTDPLIRRDEDDHPVSATMSVFRLVQGQKCEFSATAIFAEYCPNRGGGTWATLPTVMLSKVVESLCLRKGFPAETHGLYTRAELDQADDDMPSSGARSTPNPVPASVTQIEVVGESTPYDDAPHPADIPEPTSPSFVNEPVPAGCVRLTAIKERQTRQKPPQPFWIVTDHAGTSYKMWASWGHPETNEPCDGTTYATLIDSLITSQEPVLLHTEPSTRGDDIIKDIVRRSDDDEAPVF